MSSLILSGDFTVYYAGDTGGDKQIVWTGSASGTRSVNELYGALQDLFDNDTVGVGDHMSEGVPLSAQTPTEYTLGIIESNDPNPWYIDHSTIQHLTGGAITTVGYARVEGSAAGIIYVPRTGSSIVIGDRGYAISHADGDSGTLLDINGSNNLVIRPASSGATDNWNTGSGNITCNTHIDAQNGAPQTGEDLYTNIYSIGTLVTNTRIYIYQLSARIVGWWSDGHFDVLIKTQEFGLEIDDSILVVYARQYGKLYDHYQVSVPSGGRNPIPFSTSNDLNNDTGYKIMTISGASGDYTVGEVITGSLSTAQGIVTAETGSPSSSVEYYLIGVVTTDFQASETITGSSSSVTGTSAAPANNGPTASPSSGITVIFGDDSKDLINDNGLRPYSVVVDCNGATIKQVYERFKYLTRYGEITNIDDGTQTIIGEQYRGVGEKYIPYDGGSVAVPFSEGGTVSSTIQTDFSGTITRRPF